MNKKFNKKEKELIKYIRDRYDREPVSKIHFWISMVDIRRVMIIQSYAREITLPQAKIPLEKYDEFSEEEIKYEICNVIYHNFKKYIWELVLSGKYENYAWVYDKMISVPTFYSCTDGDFYADGHILDLDKAIEFFGVKYESKQDVDIYNNPRITIDIIFDVENSVKKLKSL